MLCLKYDVCDDWSEQREGTNYGYGMSVVCGLDELSWGEKRKEKKRGRGEDVDKSIESAKTK